MNALTMLKDKMQEYIDTGAQLGWLIDPTEKQVTVYRANGEVEIIKDQTSVKGDPDLPGFALSLSIF